MVAPSDPPAEVVRDQLQRLKRSAVFSGSGKLFSFLNFIVEETIERKGLGLKEWVIGNAVYSGKTPYDPRIDSTVRVEARRLRRKLAEHYGGVGRLDPVVIALPLGGYVPTFALNAVTARLVPARPLPAGLNLGALAVVPFRALSPRPEDAVFADELTDELIFLAAQAEDLRVAPRMAVFQYRDEVLPIPTLAQALGVDALVHGALRWLGQSVRLTIELCDATGFVIWSDRFDVQGQERPCQQELLAAGIWTRLRARLRTDWPTPRMASLIGRDEASQVGRRLLDS